MTELIIKPEFLEWPKIARLNRQMIVTEKLDGTNAAVIVTDDGQVWAQSRKRVIVPGDDNFGFASWVQDHADELRDGLGPGYHFGEWWGRGIQRGYGLDEKRFSLFNTSRWNDDNTPSCVSVVPILKVGISDIFSTDLVNLAVEQLRIDGSRAAPGFMKPEGVIVFHVAAQHFYKVTLEKDEAPKGAA